MATEALIVSMERGETAASKSPMWRCETQDGERVNIFQHRDPTKDSFTMFAVAGYGDRMKAMEVGERLRWQTYPIRVRMIKSGQWWNLTACDPMPEGAVPDPNTAFLPDAVQYRAEAALWAKRLLATSGWVVWDTETTGLSDDDEILTAGGMGSDGKGFSLLIRPQQIERVEAHIDVHGITADTARDGINPVEAYWILRKALDGKLWVIYNAEFDTRMLDLFCLRWGMSPILPLATVDAVEMFARFACEWDEKKGRLKYFSLKDAAEYIGIFSNQFHNADADVMTTLAVIEAMAEKSE